MNRSLNQNLLKKHECRCRYIFSKCTFLTRKRRRNKICCTCCRQSSAYLRRISVRTVLAAAHPHEIRMWTGIHQKVHSGRSSFSFLHLTHMHLRLDMLDKTNHTLLPRQNLERGIQKANCIILLYQRAHGGISVQTSWWKIGKIWCTLTRF